MKTLLIFLLGIIIGALVAYFYFNSPIGNITPPKGVITPAQATTLNQAFNSRHALISTDIVKRPDNRSSWYSLTDIRNYLNYAESQVKDLGYTMNGVRVYLAAYPDTSSEVGYTTTFFVPTGNKTSDKMPVIINSPDISGASGLNMGGNGYPPNANYPQ